MAVFKDLRTLTNIEVTDAKRIRKLKGYPDKFILISEDTKETTQKVVEEVTEEVTENKKRNEKKDRTKGG